MVGKYICNEIIAEVKKSKYYNVIVDEVADISNKEQLSVSLRYVYYGTVKKVFMCLSVKGILPLIKNFNST